MSVKENATSTGLEKPVAPKKPRTRRVLQYFEPLFSKKNVDESRCALSKLIKLVATRLGETNESFNAKHQDWYTAGNGKGSRTQLHSSLNNFRQAIIDKASITYDYFGKVIYGVLNLNVLYLSITIVHPFTKETITINSNSTFEEQVRLREEEKKKANIIS